MIPTERWRLFGMSKLVRSLCVAVTLAEAFAGSSAHATGPSAYECDFVRTDDGDQIYYLWEQLTDPSSELIYRRTNPKTGIRIEKSGRENPPKWRMVKTRGFVSLIPGDDPGWEIRITLTPGYREGGPAVLRRGQRTTASGKCEWERFDD
jgi:hypothetical protein